MHFFSLSHSLVLSLTLLEKYLPEHHDSLQAYRIEGDPYRSVVGSNLLIQLMFQLRQLDQDNDSPFTNA